MVHVEEYEVSDVTLIATGTGSGKVLINASAAIEVAGYEDAATWFPIPASEGLDDGFYSLDLANGEELWAQADASADVIVYQSWA